MNSLRDLKSSSRRRESSGVKLQSRRACSAVNAGPQGQYDDFFYRITRDQKAHSEDVSEQMSDSGGMDFQSDLMTISQASKDALEPEDVFPVTDIEASEEPQSEGGDDGSEKDDEPLSQPAVITWPHGGSNVYVTGSYDNWSTKRPMFRSQKDFTLIVDMPPGKHEYAFVVDGQRRLNPDNDTSRDNDGILNNVLLVKSPSEISVSEDLDVPYSQEFPDFSTYGGKEPPALPPHLNVSLLNCPPKPGLDPLALPVPGHVTLNHFYMAENKSDDILRLGITQRYRAKFVTTVYFRPMEQVDLPDGARKDHTAEIDRQIQYSHHMQQQQQQQQQRAHAANAVADARFHGTGGGTGVASHHQQQQQQQQHHHAHASHAQHARPAGAHQGHPQRQQIHAQQAHAQQGHAQYRQSVQPASYMTSHEYMHKRRDGHPKVAPASYGGRTSRSVEPASHIPAQALNASVLKQPQLFDGGNGGAPSPRKQAPASAPHVRTAPSYSQPAVHSLSRENSGGSHHSSGSATAGNTPTSSHSVDSTGGGGGGAGVSHVPGRHAAQRPAQSVSVVGGRGQNSVLPPLTEEEDAADRR